MTSPSLPPPGSPPALIAVARLLRPQGRRGEVLAEPLTDLADIFQAGRQMHLGAGTSGPPREVTLQDAWRPQGRNAGRLVLKLEGVDSISAAEQLHGRELLLREDQLPPLEADTFLVRDLVGCTVYDSDKAVGPVTDLQFPIGPDGHTRLADAADLLVVQLAALPAESEPVLIPFVRAWLRGVDLQARRIDMELPPGLLEAPGLSGAPGDAEGTAPISNPLP